VSTTDAGRLAAFGTPDSPDRAGISLQALLFASRRLDELSCARVVGNLAEAVHAAQKGGQPLATLNPATIRILSDGSVALAAGAGSPRYLAPEQVRGGAGDRRTDVFALGVMLWEALAHEQLFDGEADEAIKAAVLERAIRPPSEVNANVPAELDAICKKALARDAADRYQSARVMAAEIDAVLGDAGYPESNEQIASYVAKALAPVAAAAPRPAAGPAILPVIAPPAKSVPLPSLAPRPNESPVASAPRPATQTAILGSAVAPGSATDKPAPSVSTERARSITAPLGSQPMPPSVDPGRAKRPARPTPDTAKVSRTEILGSVVQAPERPASDRPASDKPADKSSLAVTAFLGSNASASPAPPVAAAPAAPPAAAPAPAVIIEPPRRAPDVVAGSDGPPAMPPPIQAPDPARAWIADPSPSARELADGWQIAPAASALPAGPVTTAGPAPAPPAFVPVKPSIANAETLATPALPAHLAPPERPVVAAPLAMPPGMTVSPSSPPAPIATADHEFEDERHAGPAEVVALHTAQARASSTGGRDVLAGWGWSTGSVEAIDDDVDIHDTSRANRRRLLLAVGGALAAVLVIVIVAFAASGSKGSEPSAAVEPAKPNPAKAEPAPVPAKVEPTPEPAKVEPTPEPAKVEPAPEPAKVEPAPASVEPAAAKVEPPAPEPARASPTVPEPAKVAPSAPVVAPPGKAPPPIPQPAKVATAPRPAPGPMAARDPELTPPHADPPRKAKPPEPRKTVDKPAKRPAPQPARAIGKAQPVDPYATPEAPKADPQVAYRAGLQQYLHGDASGALATFRALQSSNPGFAPTWRGLGLAYEKLGNRGQARAAFKRYLQMSPGAGDADQIRDRLEKLGP